MRIIGLYKTFDGGEFVDASLASVYDHCEHIVMVHSDVSWLGQRGNTVRRLADEWCQQNDKAGKVHHINVEMRTQEEQYAKGLEYIREHKLEFDVIMAVDADEVWEDQYFENAKRQIADNPFPAFRSNMQTYLKTPFFQVDPPYGSPTVFFADPDGLLRSPRGCRAHAKQLSDVWMHHFTYVRETRDDVARKIYQSCYADGGEEVLSRWMEDVYDRMPAGSNLHAFARHTDKWKRIKKVWLSDLPEKMQTAKLMPNWMPMGDTMMPGEMNAIHRLTEGRNLAVDLGTLFGLTASVLAISCNQVHTVDCYSDLPEDSYADSLDPNRYHKFKGHSLQRTKELCERWGNITCEQNHTVQAAKTWGRGLIDVLLVDAGHSEKEVMADVEAWRVHLRKGARMLIHDNNDIHPGVQQAINRLRDDKRFRVIDPGRFSGSLAVFDVN